MGVFVNLPFALFCLKDLSVSTLENILQTAHDGSTIEAWLYYLAVKDYAAAPRRKPEGGNENATKVPVDRSFKSPFVGQTVDSVAEWLKEAPKDVNLERKFFARKFFAVLDKKAEAREPSVVICRIGDKDGKGDVLKCILWEARGSSLMLWGIEYGDFDDVLEGQGEYKPEVYVRCWMGASAQLKEGLKSDILLSPHKDFASHQHPDLKAL